MLKNDPVWNDTQYYYNNTKAGIILNEKNFFLFHMKQIDLFLFMDYISYKTGIKK